MIKPLHPKLAHALGYSRGSQPVVRIPLVVREGPPGGMRVTSTFSQKPGFTAF